MNYNALPEFHGFVESVYCGIPGQVESGPTKRLICIPEGIMNDRHMGMMHFAGVRERHEYELGLQIRNNRQWSALSHEELQCIREKMGISQLDPSWLGPNFVTLGIPHLSRLPPLTKLIIGKVKQHAVHLIVYEQNIPCDNPGRIIAEHYEQPALVPRFVTAAEGRRGLIGWIEKPGTIRQGDPIEIKVPTFYQKARENPEYFWCTSAYQHENARGVLQDSMRSQKPGSL